MNVERPRFVLLDKRHGFLREPRGQITLILDRLAAAVERRALNIVELQVVMAAAAEEPVALVKAAADGALLDGETEMPFAEGAGHVAGGLQETRKDFFRLLDAAASFARCIDAGALLVAARQHSGARGGADVAADIALREKHTRAREGIEVGRGDFFGVVRIEAEVGVALIVAEDDYDVGRSGRRCGERRAGGGADEQHGEQGERGGDETIWFHAVQWREGG